MPDNDRERPYTDALRRHLTEHGVLKAFAEAFEIETLGGACDDGEAIRRARQRWNGTAGRHMPLEAIGPALRLTGSLGEEFEELLEADTRKGSEARLQAENDRLRRELQRARKVPARRIRRVG